MNILPISDTHCEFHRDNGKSFFDSIDNTGFDVLILAGDINNITGNRLYDNLVHVWVVSK